MWLRRDLRLHDHAALAKALSYGGAVQPVFIFDTDVLERFKNPRDRRLSFIANALTEIDAKLRERGGELVVLHGRAQELVGRLATVLGAQRVVAAEDYEPSARARDAAVAKNVALELVKDQLIFNPKETAREDGSPYKVFTPFYKSWLARLEREKTAIGKHACDDAGRYTTGAAEKAAAAGLPVLHVREGAAAMLARMGYEYGHDKLWQPAFARKATDLFMTQKFSRYAKQRDLVAVQGTSRLSPHLRFGLVSVRELVREAGDVQSVWVKELVWREFYASILYHYPDSVMREWNADFRSLGWSHNPVHLEAWKEGRTGYPLVDAAMRQLKREGWMHNRARMVVASFLTKDLQIDWRLGEEHFAQWLMDYEQASNVGGWQWAASTGTDAQPWFRIFNPILQSKKFDSDGHYIRYFVPELNDVKGDAIHEPWKTGGVKGYPEPIVDHATARAKTLAMFKAVSRSADSETV